MEVADTIGFWITFASQSGGWPCAAVISVFVIAIAAIAAYFISLMRL